ncbi:hypothetical protein ACFX2I_030921 [Malus domestica]
MSPFRTLLLLKPQNPLFISQTTHKPLSLFSIARRFFTSSHQTENQTKPRKPLDLLFKEAVELSPKPENSDSEAEDNALKKSLRDLEKEVRSLRANSNGETKAKKREPNSEGKASLYSVFTNKAAAAVDGSGRKRKELTKERSNTLKDLSQDMEVVVSHLYKEGYFKDANFLFVNGDRLDFSCFNNSYGRSFLRFAVESFARDNQLIAKWLSGSDLKKVALLGCPSLARKSVFGAKRMRKFFEIPEDKVCSKCVLKQSCKFANQNVWNGGAKNLDLRDVMNTITLYALDAVPPELVVPDEVKSSVSRLLKEVLKLSEVTL